MGVTDPGNRPRKEVLEGELTDAVFAADFGKLVAGDPDVSKVYSNGTTFFANTHPAQQLCRVVRAVFGRLADRT